MWHRKEAAIGYALHFHNEFELALILRSRGLRHVGDSIEPYQEGDLLLAAPGVPHSYESQGDAMAVHEQVVVQFSPALFGDTLAHPALAPVAQLLKDAAHGVCFSAATQAACARSLIPMVDEPPLLRSARLLEVLQRLAEDGQRRRLSHAAFGGKSDVLEPIDRVCQHLHANFEQPITVAIAASLAGMSSATFTRAFRRSTGRTLVAYLNELRLRKACRLLLETERTVAEVAAAAGFDNLAYFNRRFLGQFGLRPSEYRRQGPKRTLE